MCCFPELDDGQKIAPAGNPEFVFLHNFFRIIDLQKKKKIESSSFLFCPGLPSLPHLMASETVIVPRPHGE